MQQFCPLTLALLTAASGASYGPGDCVSIHRSSVGTCVMQTKCDGRDVTNFDFVFNCVVSANNSTIHNLGVGSLDTEEEYDTGVQCSECLPLGTSSRKSRAPPAKASRPHTRMFQLKSEEPSLIQDARSSHSSRSGPPTVQRYGPGACVKTWRDSASGHCIMETDCPASEDLTVYEFGLLCQGQGEELTRHVFGQDSFEHHETFDTLIECEECMALDEYMDAGKSMRLLAQEVESLKGGMENVTADIAKLEAAVGGPAPGPAPAPASENATASGPAAAASGPAAAALMAHRRPAQAQRVQQARAAVQRKESSFKRTATKVHSRRNTAHGRKAGSQRKQLRSVSQLHRRMADSEVDRSAAAETDSEVDDEEADGTADDQEQDASTQSAEPVDDDSRPADGDDDDQ